MSQKIRMTLLIDERSHPELYADLADIEGDRNRTERVRYLAGIGLVLTANRVQVTAPQATTPLRVDSSASAERPTPEPRPTAASARPESTSGAAETEIPSAHQPLGRLHVDKTAATSGAPRAEALLPPQQDAESPAQRAARQMAQAGLFGRPSEVKPSEP